MKIYQRYIFGQESRRDILEVMEPKLEIFKGIFTILGYGKVSKLYW